MNPFPRILTMIFIALMHAGLPEAAYGAFVAHADWACTARASRYGFTIQYGLKTERVLGMRTPH